jgi:dipeptidyl aminopeptidase/acylaminoacyl peptidase
MTKSAAVIKPGEWPSPLHAHHLAEAGVVFQWTQNVGEDVWWSELRPSEGGRAVVVSRKHGDLLPPPFDAKHRVHEYGGLSWLGFERDGEPHLLFSNKKDQRLYLTTVNGTPQAVTPEESDVGRTRFADLQIVNEEIWCIREETEGVTSTRSLVAISFSGQIRTLDDSSHFYSRPRLSPNGNQLAWTCWEHPLMPWDGTELRVADVSNGELVNIRTLAGSAEESIQSHEWLNNQTLAFISDASGWWNPWQITLSGTKTQLISEASEWGIPEWQLGYRTLSVLDDGRLLCLHGSPERTTFAIVDPQTNTFEDIATDINYWAPTFSVSGKRIFAIGAATDALPLIAEIDIASRSKTILKEVPSPIDAAYFTTPRAIAVPGRDGRTVHAILHPAHNPNLESGERPPLVVTAHGGPTSHVSAVAKLAFAYFTTRGISVVDVNYGGSTGYGREYRNLLRGQWGVVDHEDVISVVESLVAAGEVDPSKVAIRGGSAGGYTVLNALLRSDVFAVGANYYGVADLTPFIEITHDFEARYLDSLIGPYPERADLYQERSPLTYADNLSTPLIIFQGSDDPIVPPSQSELFRDVCQRKGIKHKYFPFDGESHGFVKAETIITAAEEELLFFGDVMGFKAVL